MDEPYTARALNRLLANYFVLSIKLFRYKCYAKGEHAYSNKLLFNSIQAEINQDINTLASFIASIGGKPYATMIKFIKESTIEEATADDEEEEMITQLIDDFTVINEQMEVMFEDASEAVKYFLFSMQRKLLHNRHICLQMRE